MRAPCTWVLCTWLLAGCPGLRHHSTRNASGNVDLATPLPGERGDPAAYQEAEDPGEHQLGVAPGLAILFAGDGASQTHVELGGEVHVSFGERDTSGARGAFGYPLSSWGATVGGAYDPDTAHATVFLEGRRFWYGLAASAGVAVDPTPGDVDLGGQVTLQASIFAVRMRYLAARGFEAFAGYHVYLPASVTWSR